MTFPSPGLFPDPQIPVPLPTFGTIWSVDTFTGYEGMSPVPDDLGCLWFVTDVDGWEGAGAPRVQSDDRPTSDGTNDGQSTQPGRTVTLSGTVRAPDVKTLQQAMGRITGLLMTGDRYGTLSVAETWLGRAVRVRRGAETLVAPTRTVAREASFSIVLYAPDPRRLASALSAASGLPASAGGLLVPFRVPFKIAASTVTGVVTLVNAGTVEGPVMLRLDGPLTPPIVVTHVGSGLQLVFGSDLPLPAGQFLTVDMERREVLANGQAGASRNQYVRRDGRGWSGFDPGVNEWAFAAAGGSGLMTVTAAPAWA